MSRRMVVREFPETREVAGTAVLVNELLWDDGGRSFEVARVSDGEDLTAFECFDASPTDEQLAELVAACPYSRLLAPAGVERVRDKDGDRWHRAGDGYWWLPPTGKLRTWDDVWGRFGPLTPDEV